MQNAEIKRAQFGSDSRETAQLVSYAELVPLSREALINNDSAPITTTMEQAGRAAFRKIGDLAYALILANNTTSDGYNLFSSEHSNDATSAGVPSVATLEALRLLMGNQTGPERFGAEFAAAFSIRSD